MEAVVVLWDVLKKAVELPSGVALTEIVTPFAGIADVIFTFRGKVGPTAGACVLPDAGLVVTEILASSVFFPPPQPDKKDESAKIDIANI